MIFQSCRSISQFARIRKFPISNYKSRPWYVENDPASHNEQMLPPAAIKFCQKKIIMQSSESLIVAQICFLVFLCIHSQTENKRLRSSDVRHRLTPEPLKYDPALHSLHTSIEEAPEIQT